MRVSFAVLGEIEVRVDGRVVDIGHARQRCVLVALLVDANRVVPVDQVLDRVWAQHPPQRARNVLSGYVSRLRQRFAGTGEIAIDRRSGGYVLTVDPDAVDVHRFRRLAAEARANGDEAEALATLERALGLWRGEPFAELDTPWLNDLRTSLEAQRVAAELDRNDLALARGRHVELLEELAARAAAHPLDERLIGQLMLALYQAGRQAEALLEYERLRRGLADELGTDPGPSLRQLHHRILNADRALTAGTAARIASPAEPSAPVPRQLPAPPGSFTGRVRELAALDAIADLAGAAGSGGPIVGAVSGTAGVGKTALAVHWAHRVAERFPDGQLYANLRGFDPGGPVLTPAEAVRGFLEALEFPSRRIPVSPEAQAGRYRSLLAGRRMLIVLDNARDADQVRPLVPGTRGCLVLVTSRDRLAGLVAACDARPVTLDLLTPAEARDLLANRLGRERLAAEPTAVDEIVARCAGLPLALAIVAARAAGRPDFPLAVLASELAEAERGLDPFAGGDHASDARAVFSWSYRTLRPATARLFRLLGLHPGPDTTAAAAASLAGLPLVELRPLLAELTRAHLLTEHRPGRYTFHDLLRAYAAERTRASDPDDERRAALHRLLDHYLHTAHAAVLVLNPHRMDRIGLTPAQPGVTPERPAGRAEAMAWFAAEHAVLLTAVDRAAAAGFDTHAWQLGWALWTFLDWRGHWLDLRAVGRAGLAAARRCRHLVGQAVTHRMLGRACMMLDLHADAQAHLRRALKLYRAAGDVVGRASAHSNIAVASEPLGQYPRALRHARRSLQLFGAAGHARGRAHALAAVGWCHALLDNHRHAINYCRRALVESGEVGDRVGEAFVWDSLGYVFHHLGDHERSARHYRLAIDRYVELGDRYLEATTTTRLGDVRRAAGDDAGARAHWRRAVAILDELGHPDAEQVHRKLDSGTHRAA